MIRMSDSKVIIYGCGGHGRVIYDILLNMNNVNIIGFVDDDIKMVGNVIHQIKVLGTSEILYDLLEDGINQIVLGIGDNNIRANLFSKWEKAGFRIYNAIHPSAYISKTVELGKGIVIMAGTVINTGSIIGDNVCINTGATIDHDNKLGDHVHIYPGSNLTGGVCVGSYTYIGSNAVVNPYISVGNHVIIGSGSVVINDIPDNVTVFGVPAKVIQKK